MPYNMDVLMPEKDELSDLKPKDAHSSLDELDTEDLYVRYKKLQKTLEFIEVQEEYIKDEQRNLKKEYLHAQEEVKRIQSVPLVIGQFLEAVDQNTGIVGSTTGSNYYVRILSTIDRELLKPSASVALHKHSNALVDVLPPEADSSISMLQPDEKPDVSYADIGGMDMQKQEIREAVELPLTHFELYKQIGIRAEISRRGTAHGARRLPAGQGERAGHHLHRRDRCDCHQALRCPDGRRSRGAAHSARAAQPDGRLRSDHQCQGDHGHQSGGHAGSCPAASRSAGPKDRVPAARSPTEATGLLHHHLEDEPQRGRRSRGVCGAAR
nr:26S proteasome regulatory subunit 6B isoform X2 [Drosophila takahashii]